MVRVSPWHSEQQCVQRCTWGWAAAARGGGLLSYWELRPMTSNSTYPFSNPSCCFLEQAASNTIPPLAPTPTACSALQVANNDVTRATATVDSLMFQSVVTPGKAVKWVCACVLFRLVVPVDHDARRCHEVGVCACSRWACGSVMLGACHAGVLLARALAMCGCARWLPCRRAVTSPSSLFYHNVGKAGCVLGCLRQKRAERLAH